MANKLGQVTFGLAGTDITVTGGLELKPGTCPDDLEFWVGPKDGANATCTFSSGIVDSSGAQRTITIFNDGTNRTENAYNDRCIYVWEHTGGTWVEALKVVFKSFVASGGSYGFKFDVITPNSHYPVRLMSRV